MPAAIGRSRRSARCTESIGENHQPARLDQPLSVALHQAVVWETEPAGDVSVVLTLEQRLPVGPAVSATTELTRIQMNSTDVAVMGRGVSWDDE